MKIWTKTTEFREGKFLVVRRDGTTPDWPHFVMGARDPAVPPALVRYADQAIACGFGTDYAESVVELSEDFRRYRAAQGDGDPPAPPHRIDEPMVLAMMRHELSVADVIAALKRIEEASAEGHPMIAAAIARLLLNGRKPKTERELGPGGAQ